MIRYNNLKQHPSHFKVFTGLKVEEFDKLAADISRDWQNARIKRLLSNNPNRQILQEVL